GENGLHLHGVTEDSMETVMDSTLENDSRSIDGRTPAGSELIAYNPPNHIALGNRRSGPFYLQ
ncbi:MAG: hypothetical protein WBY88_11970, partial [Desulfosarcina sp.]